MELSSCITLNQQVSHFPFLKAPPYTSLPLLITSRLLFTPRPFGLFSFRFVVPFAFQFNLPVEGKLNHCAGHRYGNELMLLFLCVFGVFVQGGREVRARKGSNCRSSPLPPEKSPTSPPASTERQRTGEERGSTYRTDSGPNHDLDQYITRSRSRSPPRSLSTPRSRSGSKSRSGSRARPLFGRSRSRSRYRSRSRSRAKSLPRSRSRSSRSSRC